jgi:hypothetical protein
LIVPPELPLDPDDPDDADAELELELLLEPHAATPREAATTSPTAPKRLLVLNFFSFIFVVHDSLGVHRALGVNQL